MNACDDDAGPYNRKDDRFGQNEAKTNQKIGKASRIAIRAVGDGKTV